MILDHAAKIVASDGVSAITMENLGKKVGVSKALVYAYFPTTTDLLKKLLTREYKHLRELQDAAAQDAKTMEQVVRGVTNAYLSYIEDRGLILERLSAEPEISDQGDPTQYARSSAVNYLSKLFNKNLGVPMEVAVPMVDISFGIPTAAGQYLIRNQVERSHIEEIAVSMILGGVNSIIEKSDLSFKVLDKDV